MPRRVQPCFPPGTVDSCACCVTYVPECNTQLSKNMIGRRSGAARRQPEKTSRRLATAAAGVAARYYHPDRRTGGDNIGGDDDDNATIGTIRSTRSSVRTAYNHNGGGGGGRGGDSDDARARRIATRARDILNEEEEAQRLADSMRQPRSSAVGLNRGGGSVSGDGQGRQRSRSPRCRSRSRERRRGCQCGYDISACRCFGYDGCRPWSRPYYSNCVTPLYGVMASIPSLPCSRGITTAVDTVCNINGGCYSVSQPIATACSPFGCTSVPIAPPNLTPVADVGWRSSCPIFI
jgi:hypothetical protein